MQNVLRNFSFDAFNRRSRNYLIALLFTFGVVDLLVLPYFIYTWSVSSIAGILSLVFVSFLFIIGTFSKRSAIGGIVAFVLFIIWTVVGLFYLPGHYHLSWPPATIFLIGFIISLFRLELLRKH